VPVAEVKVLETELDEVLGEKEKGKAKAE